MANVRYTREFHYGDKGPDVEGVGRALARSHTRGNTGYFAFIAFPKRIRQGWGKRKQADLKRFKRKHGLRVDSVYTKQAHEKLSPYFDSKARKLMEQYHPPLPESERHWQRLYAAMSELNAHTRGYVYGAGHGVRLDNLSPHDSFDCSSSTSYVLHKAGLFPHEYAWVSGEFASSYGLPGQGKYFTIYANGGHVWIRLHRSRWWRFDTSPNEPNDNRSGPRFRLWPRFTFGFYARHFPGM